ncbi:class I SAM-dependent methyltransferase [Anabaena sp. CCY 9402-a]|uniref:class I SAM-dependent methyltransferase n=1 Tax=Anabaena sp. CCY 9402-a TaxID=3103867 RepID=UPI0039C650C7
MMNQQNQTEFIQNMLYRQPALYEQVYKSDNYGVVKEIIERYLKRLPTSILDIGCGTGRDLQYLSALCSDCVGIDYLPGMIDYAKSNYPNLSFHVGDMRSFRLGRTFDTILALGWVLNYAWTEEDLAKTLETCQAHAQPNTLLILEMLNGGRLIGKTFRDFFEIDIDSFYAQATASYQYSRHQQILTRERVWKLPDSESVTDCCQYRLYFPAELKRLLRQYNFEIVGLFDDRSLQTSELDGELLFAAAVYHGK